MDLGERLKTARRRAGLSLRAVAARAQLSAQAISKYERGLDVPSSEVLIRLADALHVSLEWLLRPLPREISLTPLVYRCRHSRLRVRERHQIESQVRDWLERCLAIEELLGERPLMALAHLQRPIEEIEHAEEAAEELRRVWQLGENPIPSLIDTLEANGIRVGTITGAVHFDATAFLLADSEPVIIVKQDVPGDRQRFSLAHELGHLILQMPAAWGRKEIEAAAQRFAGAFLVPRSAAMRELGARRRQIGLFELRFLKHRYGMSMQAWIQRAQDLDIISAAVAQAWHRHFRQNRWHVREPGDEYPAEKTTRLERLVVRALQEELISQQRAAELLARPFEEFVNTVPEGHGNLSALVCA